MQYCRAYNHAVFGIGGGELFVIVLVALLVFGPSRLPEIARGIKRGLTEWNRLRRQVDDTVGEIRQELDLRLLDEAPPVEPAPDAVPDLPHSASLPLSEHIPPGRPAIWPATRPIRRSVALEDDYLAPEISAEVRP